MKKRRSMVTIETEEVWVIKASHQEIDAWCPQCREYVSMMVPEKAAATLNTTVRAIFYKVEMGEVHFIETKHNVLICANSLVQHRITPKISDGKSS